MVGNIPGAGAAGPSRNVQPMGHRPIELPKKLVLPKGMYTISDSGRVAYIPNPVELIPVTVGLIRQFESEAWAKSFAQVNAEKGYGEGELASVFMSVKFAVQLVERLNEELAPQGLRARIPTEAVARALQGQGHYYRLLTSTRWDPEVQTNPSREIEAEEVKNDTAGKLKYVALERDQGKRSGVNVFATGDFHLYLEVIKA